MPTITISRQVTLSMYDDTTFNVTKIETDPQLLIWQLVEYAKKVWGSGKYQIRGEGDQLASVYVGGMYS